MQSVTEEASSANPAANDDEEWMLLPGLFSWDEVCSLFAAEAGHDEGWRFAVRRELMHESDQPLYVVQAALRPKIFERKGCS